MFPSTKKNKHNATYFTRKIRHEYQREGGKIDLYQYHHMDIDEEDKDDLSFCFWNLCTTLLSLSLSMCVCVCVFDDHYLLLQLKSSCSMEEG